MSSRKPLHVVHLMPRTRRLAPLVVAAALLLIYLLLAHWSLYSGWAVLGDGPWMPRLAAAVFGLVAPTIAIEGIAPGAPLALLLLLALAYAALVVIPLAIARTRGYRCRLPDEAPDAITSRQFSLRQIFVLTTVVAVMLTLVRLIGPLTFGGDPFTILMIFLSPAVVTWAAFPLMLTARYLPGSLGVMAVSGLVGGVLALLVYDRGLTVGIMLLLGLTLVVALGILRGSGYRLQRATPIFPAT